MKDRRKMLERQNSPSQSRTRTEIKRTESVDGIYKELWNLRQGLSRSCFGKKSEREAKVGQKCTGGGGEWIRTLCTTHTHTHYSHHRCIPFEAAHSPQALIIYLSGTAVGTRLTRRTRAPTSRSEESTHSLLFTLPQREENTFLHYSKTIFPLTDTHTQGWNV